MAVSRRVHGDNKKSPVGDCTKMHIALTGLIRFPRLFRTQTARCAFRRTPEDGVQVW